MKGNTEIINRSVSRIGAALKTFVGVKDVKEMLVLWVLLAVAVVAVHMLVGVVEGFVVGAVGSISLMIGFHVLWIYREHTEKEHPVAFAVGVEIANILIGAILFAIAVGLSVVFQHFAGIPFFTSLLTCGLIVLALLVGRALWAFLKY